MKIHLVIGVGVLLFSNLLFSQTEDGQEFLEIPWQLRSNATVGATCTLKGVDRGSFNRSGFAPGPGYRIAKPGGANLRIESFAVRTDEDRLRNENQHASAYFKYAQASGRADFERSKHNSSANSSMTLSLNFRARYAWQSLEMTDVSKATGSDLQANGEIKRWEGIEEGGKERILNKYGTHAVVGIQREAVVKVLISIDASSSRSFRDLSASFGVDWHTGKVDAGIKSVVKQIDSAAKIRFEVVSTVGTQRFESCISEIAKMAKNDKPMQEMSAKILEALAKEQDVEAIAPVVRVELKSLYVMRGWPPSGILPYASELQRLAESYRECRAFLLSLNRLEYAADTLFRPGKKQELIELANAWKDREKQIVQAHEKLLDACEKSARGEKYTHTPLKFEKSLRKPELVSFLNPESLIEILSVQLNGLDCGPIGVNPKGDGTTHPKGYRISAGLFVRGRIRAPRVFSFGFAEVLDEVEVLDSKRIRKLELTPGTIFDVDVLGRGRGDYPDPKLPGYVWTGPGKPRIEKALKDAKQRLKGAKLALVLVPVDRTASGVFFEFDLIEGKAGNHISLGKPTIHSVPFVLK